MKILPLAQHNVPENFCQQRKMMQQKQPTIEVCFSPRLFDTVLIKGETVVVVVDILRATTSMVAALNNGATSVIPHSSLEAVRNLKKQGYLVAAERDGQKLDFADFGNSAFDFMNADIKGRTIVFSTTNGTVAIETAKKMGQVVIGAFSNISALASWLIKQQKNVVILCSGWQNTFCLEDTIFAGSLTEKLMLENKFMINCDSAHAALDLWRLSNQDLIGYIQKALHRKRLRKLGMDDVLEYSIKMDTAMIVPMLMNGVLVDVY